MYGEKELINFHMLKKSQKLGQIFEVCSDGRRLSVCCSYFSQNHIFLSETHFDTDRQKN
jgi:hypothetical protein